MRCRCARVGDAQLLVLLWSWVCCTAFRSLLNAGGILLLPALQDPMLAVQQPEAVACLCLAAFTHAPCLLAAACLPEQELYGDEVGGAMLNALSRLFTARLQDTGFTCGMDDLLLTAGAEAGRSQVGVLVPDGLP